MCLLVNNKHAKISDRQQTEFFKLIYETSRHALPTKTWSVKKWQVWWHFCGMRTCLTKPLDFPQFNLCCGSKTSFVQPLSGSPARTSQYFHHAPLVRPKYSKCFSDFWLSWTVFRPLLVQDLFCRCMTTFSLYVSLHDFCYFPFFMLDFVLLNFPITLLKLRPLPTWVPRAQSCSSRLMEMSKLYDLLSCLLAYS